MKIDARIHESRISRIVVGQPVEIEIDAIPGDLYRGKLQSISSVPVPGSWPNTDLKEYEAVIEILDDAARVRKLKPGMTAQVRIIVEDRKENVLQIPVQAVVSFSGEYFAYVATAKGTERRSLKVGDANDEYMEILDGVAIGEAVVMSPRTHFSKELSELESEISARYEQNREKVDTPERKPDDRFPGAGGAASPPGDAAASSPGKRGGSSSAEKGNSGEPAVAAGGPPRGMQDPKAAFESMDKNKDGAVTKEEHPRPEFFDRSDTNADGKITLEEMEESFRQRQQQQQQQGTAG
jgi:hypothetical protein